MKIKTLLERVENMRADAERLSDEIEAAGQFVAVNAFQDVIYGLRKTKNVWNHKIDENGKLITP
jgi:hypothetical protein